MSVLSDSQASSFVIRYVLLPNVLMKMSCNGIPEHVMHLHCSIEGGLLLIFN